MTDKNLPAIRPQSWGDTLEEFPERAVNEYYKPKPEFGVLTSS